MRERDHQMLSRPFELPTRGRRALEPERARESVCTRARARARAAASERALDTGSCRVPFKEPPMSQGEHARLSLSVCVRV